MCLLKLVIIVKFYSQIFISQTTSTVSSLKLNFGIFLIFPLENIMTLVFLTLSANLQDIRLVQLLCHPSTTIKTNTKNCRYLEDTHPGPMQMLFVNSAARCVQYWFRLLKQPLNRYSRKAYEMLYGMQERDCASRNWVEQIKFILCYKGFGYVWMCGCVRSEMFITKFKNRLRGCCCQRWFSHLAKSERFDLYSRCKNILERERCLEVIQSRVYKTALARFHTGVSRMNGHRLRFSVAENRRLCPFCVDTFEDECHVLFVCPVYSQLRDKFPLPLYRGLHEKERYCRVCSDSDDKNLLNMSGFIFFSLNLRESLIE